MSGARFLGRGWAFPVVPGGLGGLPLAEGVEKVEQSLRILLDTEPGERVMRPAYGCGLRRYLMRPNDAGTRALIAADVEAAITRFEPRVRLSAVRVDPGEDPALVVVHLAYRHVRDDSPGNLVYPFYLAR